MKFEKRKYQYKCHYYAKTNTWNGNRRILNGYFEGHQEDIVSRCQLELNYRLQKPHIWYGVEITITTPLGQKIKCIIESRHDGFGIVLEKITNQ